MIDYFSFQAGAKYPALSAVLYTVLLAFLLSTAIAITYFFTTPREKQSRSFFQAMVLASIVASTVMQAIGDSLAVGLGMLGALAIIRFRNTLEDPRDIIFMFAALAAGLACGVYGFTIALVGTLGFCLVAFVLNASAFDARKALRVRIRFQQFKGQEVHEVETLLNHWAKRFQLKQVRVRKSQSAEVEEEADLPEVVDYEFIAQLRNQADYRDMVAELQEVQTIWNLRINQLSN